MDTKELILYVDQRIILLKRLNFILIQKDKLSKEIKGLNKELNVLDNMIL